MRQIALWVLDQETRKADALMKRRQLRRWARRERELRRCVVRRVRKMRDEIEVQREKMESDLDREFELRRVQEELAVANIQVKLQAAVLSREQQRVTTETERLAIAASRALQEGGDPSSDLEGMY